MAYISFQPKDYYKTLLYTGNGSAGNSITGVGFQPDWTWIKNRSNTESHALFDVVRGVTKRIASNSTGVEETNANTVTAFGTDGFTVGTNAGVNGNGISTVAWNWKAGNSQGSSNTDGSINTTYTSVSTTSGFSISKYTGTGSNATVGHGLGVAPKMIIVKNLTDARSWGVYHESLGATKGIDLDGNGSAGTASSYWNDTAPTNSVFSIGTANNTGAAQTYVAYCFAEIKGFSKFGMYKGNNNADGPFIYCGFNPAFIMIKRTNSSASWVIIDNQRSNPFNPQDRLLFPNTNAGEDGAGETYNWDFVGNGVKLRTTSGSYGNGSGDSYIYMAFAEKPLVSSNNIPTTAG